MMAETMVGWPFFIDDEDGFIWEESRSEPGSGACHLTKEDAVRALNLMYSAAEEQREEMRVAVAAETERCAGIDTLLLIVCPKCHVGVGEFCLELNGEQTHPHVARWRAAIRRTPEPARVPCGQGDRPRRTGGNRFRDNR